MVARGRCRPVPGPVDDRADYEIQKVAARHHYLRDALTAFLAGEPYSTDVPDTSGCLVSFPDRIAHSRRQISYTEEIVPILQNRCVKCHRDGAIAPWAMDSYRQIRGWSSMIRETVMTRRMPPGQIDDEIGDSLRITVIAAGFDRVEAAAPALGDRPSSTLADLFASDDDEDDGFDVPEFLR